MRSIRIRRAHDAKRLEQRIVCPEKALGDEDELGGNLPLRLLDEVPAPVIGEVLDAHGLDSAIAHEGDRVRRPDARVVAEQLLGLAPAVPLRVGRSRTGPRGATLVRGPLRANDLAHALRALAQGAGNAIDAGRYRRHR